MSPFEVVARGGFGRTAAPRLAADGTAWFTDIERGGVFRIPAGGDAVEEVVAGRVASGLVLHEQGVVVSGPSVTLIRDEGPEHELFAAGDDAAFGDLSVDPNGWVIAGARRDGPGRVLVIGPTFIAVACDEGVVRPAGLAFAADARTFFVADAADARVLAADVDRGGAIGEHLRPFAELGACAGIATDVEGGVWVAPGEGAELVRLDASGAVSARVAVPGATAVTALAFRGQEVLVTAVGESGGQVLRGRFDVAGADLPVAHV